MQKFWIPLVVVQSITIVALAVMLWTSGPASVEPEAPNVSPETSAAIDKAAELELRSPADADANLARDAGSRIEAPREAEPTRDERIGTVLFGCIVDSEGEAVEATVYIRRKDDRRGRAAATHAGSFAATGLTPGTYEISGRATGCRPHLAEVEIEARAMQRLDITLERAREIRVLLVDAEGAPLPPEKMWRWSLAAIASPSEPPDAYPMTNLRSIARRIGSGRWRAARFQQDRGDMPANCLGVLELDTNTPLWVGIVLRQQVLSKKLVAAGETQISFAIDDSHLESKLASAKVRVVDAVTGQGIENARVAFSDRQSSRSGVATDADGYAHCTKIIPGILEFEVRAKDREWYHSNMRIASGQHYELGTIRLSAPTKIRGKVLGPDGKGVAARISWVLRDRYKDDVPWDRGSNFSSRADGSFELPRCGRGSYFLQASNEQGAGDRIVDTSRGDVEGVVVRLQQGHQVEYTSDVPEDKILFVRITRRGQTVCNWLAQPYDRALQRKLMLPPDRYEVAIYEDSRLLRTIPIDTRKPGAKFHIP